MAITTLADFRAALEAPHAQITARKVFGATNSTQGIQSSWLTAGKAGAAPTTAVAPTQSTTGALGQVATFASGQLRCIKRATYSAYPGTGNITNGGVIIFDRLSHQGGVNTTITGAQTTNLPTAALTRYTDGVGVMAFVEVFTTIGTTATAARISYTNQAGTPGQTSQDFVVGGATGANQGRANGSVYAVGLADGDTGVRSVESITLDVSTGTAGAIGVVLAKPLFFLAGYQFSGYDADSLLGNTGCACPIVSDACLWAVSIQQASTPASGIFMIDLEFYKSTT